MGMFERSYKPSIFSEEEPSFDWGESFRGSIDRRTFGFLKQELKHKGAKVSNQAIAKAFGISTTSLYLVKRSKSYKQYKQIRRAHSKPYKYGVENENNRSTVRAKSTARKGV